MRPLTIIKAQVGGLYKSSPPFNTTGELDRLDELPRFQLETLTERHSHPHMVEEMQVGIIAIIVL